MRVVRDRRAALRVLIEGEVLVYTERDSVPCTCEDLSLVGMRVASPRPADTDRLVALEAFLAGQRVRLDAELVRQDAADEGFLLAFAFVDLTPQTLAQLERIIRDRLARSSQTEHATAFATGAFETPPSDPQPSSPLIRTLVEGPRDHDPVMHTVVADALPQAVVSGLTQVIAVADVEPSPTSSEPSPTATGPSPQADQHAPQDPAPPTELLHAQDLDGVSFEESMFEDEMDTAVFRRLQAEAAARGNTVVEPHPSPPPEKTVIVPIEQLLGLRFERGTPRPIIPALTPIIPMRFDSERIPIFAPTLATDHLPTLEPSVPPPALRGEPGPLSSTPTASARSDPPAASPRPSQRALHDALGLLRGPPRADPDAPRRRPRVVVAIPHRKFRSRRPKPWNRR